MNRLLPLALFAVLISGCGKTEAPNFEGNPTTTKGAPKKEEPHKIVTEDKGTKPNVNPREIKATIPKGSGFEASTVAVTEKELGLPFYPGSAESPNGSMSSKGNGTTTYLCTRTTEDDPEKVTAFYKKKLTDSSTLNTAETILASQITGKLGTAQVVVSATRESQNPLTRIVISITRQDKAH